MKKYDVMDLFSGAGGFSKGFEKEGFNIKIANEINTEICETYKINHKDTKMYNMDVKDFAEKIEELLVDNIKVVIGGPPCQGFSLAGARNRKKKFVEDERNFLFKHYFSIIQKVEPDFFIMENVEGLLSSDKGNIIKEIEKIFQDENNFKKGKYYLSKKVFLASDYGVPQERKRLIIFGSKYGVIDIEKHINKIKTKDKSYLKKTTIKDAIYDLNFVDDTSPNGECEYNEEPFSIYQKERRIGSKKIYNHVSTRHSKVALERIKKIKPGENFKNLDEEIKSIHSGSYGRMKWDDLAVTITTRFDTPSAGRFIHPEKDRVITPREAARLQSFDDDFIFLGTKSSIGTQIGNAVPPLLGKIIAKIVKEEIKNIKPKI